MPRGTARPSASFRHLERLRRKLQVERAQTRSRAYGVVQVNHRWLTEILVGKGLARRKGVIANLPTGENWRDHADRLDALEADPKRQRLGISAGSTQDKAWKDGR